MWPLRARYGRTPSPLDGLTGAVNSFYGLQGADRETVEQTLLDRWEVDKADSEELSWVAAAAEWLRPTPPGTVPPLGPTGKRFVLDTSELRFAVARRILERIGSDRPVFIWFDDLHFTSANTFETLTRLKRDATKLRIFILATARSESLETDLDAAVRMEALRADWGGRVLDLAPLGTDETEVVAPRDLAAHVERDHRRRRAEPRQPALRVAAPARVGGWGIPHARRRQVQGARRGAPRPRDHDRGSLG